MALITQELTFLISVIRVISGQLCSLRLSVSAVKILAWDDLCRCDWMCTRGFEFRPSNFAGHANLLCFSVDGRYTNDMVPNDDAAAGLREAIRVSPNNLPLRIALSEMLMGLGRYEEAEAEYRAAIGLSPDNPKLKIGLATAFYQQGKNSHALVIVEDMIKSPDVPPRALVLYAKLLLRAGDVDRAVRQYKRAIEQDTSVADDEFASRLGIQSSSSSIDEDSEVIDGKVRAIRESAPIEKPGSIEKPDVKFEDVGGMNAVKDEIRMKIIHPLAHADLYKAYGKKNRRGHSHVRPAGVRQDAPGPRNRR